MLDVLPLWVWNLFKMIADARVERKVTRYQSAQ